MASYDAFKPKIESIEGDYQDNYNDAGNWINPDYKVGQGTLVGTNKGISGPTLKAVRKKNISKQDMQALSWAESHKILKNEYWNLVKGDSIHSQPIAEQLADHAINEGPADAIRMVQGILKDDFGIDTVAVDGVIGTKTLAAINKTIETGQEAVLLSKIIQKRSERYSTASNSGWRRRLTILTDGNELAMASLVPSKVSLAWADLVKNITAIDVAKFITFSMIAVIAFFYIRKKLKNSIFNSLIN